MQSQLRVGNSFKSNGDHPVAAKKRSFKFATDRRLACIVLFAHYLIVCGMDEFIDRRWMRQRNHMSATRNNGVGSSIPYRQNEVAVTVYVKHWAVQNRSSIPVKKTGK
jgi:hypothetical protein